MFTIQPILRVRSLYMHKRIQLTLTAEKYRSVTRNNCSTRTAKFMIEFIRRINLFKTLSDDRRTLANALVKVSESKLDMSKGFFTRGPTYRGNKNPMLVPKRACRHLRDRDWDPRQVCYSVPQLLPIIFRISRNMRIQDAGPLTLLRSKSNFSSKAITIHITRVIPCLACRQSPSALRSLGMDQKLTLWYKSEYLLLVERTVIPERTQRRWEENVTSKRTSSPYEWRLL